jgi:hypothetical protein
MLFDPSGNLFVANYGDDTVTEYSPPFSNLTTPVATINVGIWPVALAMDGIGNLFVAEGVPTGDVRVYAPPYTGTPVIVTNGIDYPYALALDGAGNLFVANAPPSTATGSITSYAPPYTGAPTATITNGINNPQSLIFSP